ncbi:alcohol dehydrogenase [Skermanella aerolata]|uniref:Alcohol dehydrogenase n=1 Tax=Skermanella aerolata TaxID=393310 RepID=A0A512DMD8_9PROT|nr:PQQ-binding-like beta-propeller repeat protein [Skermanella aerolata]KJB96527.1 alcohol dehydrogenase [Skermanella aerolata KACC 11604]GEO37642.1 alcohol dehydrogenase [Skermanella aerolata]
MIPARNHVTSHGLRKFTALLGLTLAAGLAASTAGAVDPSRIVDADKSPADWLTYHGSYKSYHYSALDQINADNIRNLQVAWTHVPGRSTRGLQSMPLAADGVLYYSGSYSRLFALDGATGEVLWTHFPELNEDLIATQTHSPYNRGIALGHGKVFVGTVDGRLIAVDMKTGEPAWDTKLIDSEKLTVGFTGAPLLVKDTVIIGAQGGEWPSRGPIFGVDAATGKKKWEFFTVAGTEEAKATWGNESWRTGGGGGWMPGTYDPETNAVWWGTANPAPLYDWAGDKWQKEGPRPGLNLYTSSVIALDPDTGKLKFFHQELPHDAWDFDSAVGEFLNIDRNGRKLMVHPNKSGFIFVYDRSNAEIANVWRLVQNINFVKDIDPKTGELIGRRDMAAGKHSNLCPAIPGGISWNTGAYNPNSGLYYKVGQEWCMDLEVVKTTPIVEPQIQLNIGANFQLRDPEGGKAHGHVSGRDPVTGEKKWEVNFTEPPLASLLTTGGNLLFVPDARGYLRALNATTGQEVWKHNNGVGHNGGIISYSAKGKQYVAVETGWGSLVGDEYAALFGEPYKSMPKDSGALVVFALPDQPK